MRKFGNQVLAKIRKSKGTLVTHILKGLENMFQNQRNSAKRRSNVWRLGVLEIINWSTEYFFKQEISESPSYQEEDKKRWPTIGPHRALPKISSQITPHHLKWTINDGIGITKDKDLSEYGTNIYMEEFM